MTDIQPKKSFSQFKDNTDSSSQIIMPSKRRKKKRSKEEINKINKFKRRREDANLPEELKLQRKLRQKKTGKALKERKKIAEGQNNLRQMLEFTEQQYGECIRKGCSKFTKEERALYREEKPVKSRRLLKRGVVDANSIINQKVNTRKTLMEIGKLKISLGALKQATYELVRLNVKSEVERLEFAAKTKSQRQKEREAKLTDEERRLRLEKSAQRKKERLENFTEEERRLFLDKVERRKKRNSERAKKRNAALTENERFLKRQREVKRGFENSSIEMFPLLIVDKTICGLFACVVCKEEMGSERGLMRHYIRNHTESEISKAKEMLQKKDVKSVNKFLVRVYKCELCSEKCHQISNLRTHLMQTHPDNKEILKKICFPCSLCKEIFCFRKHLLLHLKKSHEMFTQCPVCKENMESQEAFTNHVAEFHSDCIRKDEMILRYEGGYFCQTCGYANKKYDQTKSHSQVHSPRDIFQCDLCDLKYKTKNNLIRHKLMDHEKIRCGVCERRFSDEQSCRIHNCRRREVLQKKIRRTAKIKEYLESNVEVP